MICMGMIQVDLCGGGMEGTRKLQGPNRIWSRTHGTLRTRADDATIQCLPPALPISCHPRASYNGTFCFAVSLRFYGSPSAKSGYQISSRAVAFDSAGSYRTQIFGTLLASLRTGREEGEGEEKIQIWCLSWLLGKGGSYSGIAPKVVAFLLGIFP